MGTAFRGYIVAKWDLWCHKKISMWEYISEAIIQAISESEIM